MTAGVVANIVRDGLCLGCGLCQSLSNGSIVMEDDAGGFLRPRLLGQSEPEVENDVRRMCPGIHVSGPQDQENTHLLWGPIIQSRMGHATDDATRWGGSSGGGVTGILDSLLRNGVVDFVVHTVPSEDNPVVNDVAVSRTSEDIARGLGSRYAPSAALQNICSLLEAEKGVGVFVGKPCDVAGFRNLSASRPDVAAKIVGCISFFCAGVPSIHGTYEILNALNADLGDLDSFRYRGNGWPGAAVATLRDGSKKSMDYATSWGTILNKHLQFRCKICPDGTGEQADLVCADAWYGKDGYPDFSEKDGRSLILSRTAEGERWVQLAIESGDIEAINFDVDQVALMQPYQKGRKEGLYARLFAMRLLMRKVPKYEGLRLAACSRASSSGSFLKNFLGMIWRVLRR